MRKVNTVSFSLCVAVGLVGCGSFHANFESAQPQTIVKDGGLSQVSWPGPYHTPTSLQPTQDAPSTTAAPPSSGSQKAAPEITSAPEVAATPVTQGVSAPVSTPAEAQQSGSTPAAPTLTPTDLTPKPSSGNEATVDPTADPTDVPTGNAITPQAAVGINQKSDLSQVLAKSNLARQQVGLSALQIDEKLSRVALVFAADMKAKSYFGHTAPDGTTEKDRLASLHINYRHAGENIAQGQQSAEEVLTDWMNSAGHRKNILTPEFTKIGIGHVGDIWVQEFSD